jgi:16S rRNA (guanine966-N2)-methyltransferase
MRRSTASGARVPEQGRVRIIAGRYRGRKLGFRAIDGLRPSGDRVRETLFNWLQPWLPESRCLDMFAGSGALGFECASRGAARVDMYENSAVAATDLTRNRDTLQADTVIIHRADVLQAQWHDGPYDIIFIDPPFDRQIHQQAIAMIDREGLAGEGSLVYVEWRKADGQPGVPAHWSMRRDRVAGDVGFALFSVADTGRGDSAND